jgi:RNA polymerase sigma-70 factor, ECF subfamily
MVEELEGFERSAPGSLDGVLRDAVPVLTRVAERLCGNATDAEDLLQDTFERAARLGIPHDVRSTRAWLTAILHNLFIDRCRAMARRPSPECITDRCENVAPLEPDVPEPEWAGITAADVRDAADELEPVYRDVYLLHTFEHWSYDEIACAFGVQRVTVGTRLNRARKKLREKLVARFQLEEKP